MKFLVDAQPPRRFCSWLTEAGHDAMHTLDLPRGNRTSDADILEAAEHKGRVVVTKDDDFVRSYLVTGRPKRLLLISTGNISNDALERIVRTHVDDVSNALTTATFVELGRNSLTVHE